MEKALANCSGSICPRCGSILQKSVLSVSDGTIPIYKYECHRCGYVDCISKPKLFYKSSEI